MDPVDQVLGWHRLDRRMLLVHPVREVGRFLPVLIGLLLFGRGSDGGGYWGLIGVAIPIGLGLLRYVTTSYRLTSGRVEVRNGLLNKRVVSTPLDRVRTVDLTASPIHRALGLVTVRVGTGQGGDKGDGTARSSTACRSPPPPSCVPGSCTPRVPPIRSRTGRRLGGSCSPSTRAGCASLR